MNNIPIISIITVNLNNLPGLRLTANSLPQGYDYEWIYIDGLSNDGSNDFVKNLKRKPDKIIIEKDNGIYDAMNKGIDLATGNYIWFVNSGDKIDDELQFQKVFTILEKGEFDLFYGNFKLYDNGVNKLVVQDKKVDFPWLISKTLNHQSYILKSIYLKEKKFNLNYKITSDWIQLFESFRNSNLKICYFPYSMVVYDRNGLSYLNNELRLNERNLYLKSIYSEWELVSLIKFSKLRNRIYYFDLIQNLESPYITKIIYILLKFRNVIRRK